MGAPPWNFPWTPVQKINNVNHWCRGMLQNVQLKHAMYMSYCETTSLIKASVTNLITQPSTHRTRRSASTQRCRRTLASTTSSLELSGTSPRKNWFEQGTHLLPQTTEPVFLPSPPPAFQETVRLFEVHAIPVSYTHLTLPTIYSV